MKTITVILPLLFCVQIYAQSQISFVVDKVEKATQAIETKEYKNIIDKYSEEIESYSPIKEKLVDRGTHPFLDGMHQAYAEHRPFVITPDMIWLLISQGFTNHVNNNSEVLRKYLVNFKGRKTLIVQNDKIILGNPNSPWEEVFPEFSKQIASYTGEELTNVLTANFSTTTTTEKIASQITIMDAMESYFKYEVFRIICGFPEITVKGTTADWNKIIEKTKFLSKYELEWWTEKLIPILEEISKTSENKINQEFWTNMFKIHTSKEYGNPKNIDGWITNFFPYDKSGKRIHLDQISGIDLKDIFEKLPSEIVKIKFDYKVVSPRGKSKSIVPMNFWAGFVGLSQDNLSLALEPKIGWFISKENDLLIALHSSDYEPLTFNKVSRFPENIFMINSIKDLTINFIGKINIPDNISDIKIEHLNLNGSIKPKKIRRIKALLPNTVLKINEVYIN
nr:DUF4419 domain-containing protein [uncultured Flavobacterium sp.]